MAISARIVRRILLTSGLVLIAVIVGFAGYAHYRARHFLRALPGRLGVDIKQETNGFTWSQSVAGRTVFTVHAAKEVQRTNGRITLHDVGITLYGRTPESADRIHGSEFEYDPAQGILTAAGEVYLDLEAPAGAQPGPGAAPASSRLIHVKTSGLVFLEKQRTASTSQPIEFAAGALRGRAVGASYNSAGGVVVLEHEVEIHGLRNGRALSLIAAHAELDRNRNLIRLTYPASTQETDNGTEKLSAQQSVVDLTPQGEPVHLRAEGRVLLTPAAGGTLAGDRLDVDFVSPPGRSTVLRQAQLSGNVRLNRQTPGGIQHGQMRDLALQFDAAGQPRRADLAGEVTLEERSSGSARTLFAPRVELAFTSPGSRGGGLRTAQAFGDDAAQARMLLVAADAKTGGTATTSVSAQHLQAAFAVTPGQNQLQTLVGDGRTSLEQKVTDRQGADVSNERSSGDRLRATFASSPHDQTQPSHIEQSGHVSGLRRTASHLLAGRMVPEAVQRTRSESAVYDAASNHLLLQGSVLIADDHGELSADEAMFDRDSGVASARGAVRVTYHSAGVQDNPIHITAERAQSNQATRLTQFFGSGVAGTQGPVRLWQGGTQVQAAEIDLDRNRGRIVARSDRGRVQAVLAGAGAGASARNAGTTHVLSHELVYTQATRQIELTGPVKLTQADGTLQCAHAIVSLSAAPGPPPTPANRAAGPDPAASLMTGKVERIVASGGVSLTQPGRHATGEDLVYSAPDETYVLTGTRSVPPRLVDDVHGTITGGSLRFHGSDDSVEILGGDGHPAKSETRLKSSAKGK